MYSFQVCDEKMIIDFVLMFVCTLLSKHNTKKAPNLANWNLKLF